MKRIIPYRWIRILIWLLIILVLIWCGIWFFASRWIDDRIDETITSMKDRGVTIDCEKRSVSGFPLAMNVKCETISVVTVRGTERADAGELVTGANIWDPDVLQSQLASPFVTYAGGKKLQADWKLLNAKIDGNLQGGLDGIELQGRRINVIRDDIMVTARSHLTRLTPIHWSRKLDGKMASLRLQLATRKFGLEVADGIKIPDADVRGVAVLKDGYFDLIDQRMPLQKALADGANVRINNLVLSVEGGGKLGFSGPITLSVDGLISGTVRMGIAEPQAVAKWAAQIDRNFEQAVVGLGQAVAGMGKPSKIAGQEMSTITVKIKRGEVRLGFIKLGKIPRIDLKP